MHINVVSDYVGKNIAYRIGNERATGFLKSVSSMYEIAFIETMKDDKSCLEDIRVDVSAITQIACFLTQEEYAAKYATGEK